MIGSYTYRKLTKFDFSIKGQILLLQGKNWQPGPFDRSFGSLECTLSFQINVPGRLLIFRFFLQMDRLIIKLKELIFK